MKRVPARAFLLLPCILPCPLRPGLLHHLLPIPGAPSLPAPQQAGSPLHRDVPVSGSPSPTHPQDLQAALPWGTGGVESSEEGQQDTAHTVCLPHQQCCTKRFRDTALPARRASLQWLSPREGLRLAGHCPLSHCGA